MSVDHSAQSGDDRVTGGISVLYRYGIYTRDITEIWNPMDVYPNGCRIMDLVVAGPDDYYMVLRDWPIDGMYRIVRLTSGDFVEIAGYKVRDAVEDVRMFIEPEKEDVAEEITDEIEDTESVQESGVGVEDAVDEDGLPVNELGNLLR